MNWKLFDEEEKYIQDVNCQYDASDIACMMYNASVVRLDFVNNKAYIVERDGVNE